MLFNSYIFLFLFLPITLATYYLLGHFHARWAALWLCLTSLVFYGWWNPQFVALLAGSILFNYMVGLAILKRADKPGQQRWVLIVGVVANLSMLLHYKYFTALLGALADWGLVSHGGVHDIILPLGISFFTFTQIGYLLDCRAGAVTDSRPLSYVLFVTFFPHLIAGPILHHHEMMPQFSRPESYRFKAENLSVGTTLFIIGLAKKVLLADSIAPYADAGFDNPGQLALFSAWGTSLAYALQIYFDFSGYSDMALGLAKMFGIRFPLNFNSPYKAASIIEFWARWHMTLTRYLTAYLYYPVAMSVARRRARLGQPTGVAGQRTLNGYIAMIVWPTCFTMALAGVWHGAGLQYLIFGLLHAAYLSINHGWRIFMHARPVATSQLGKTGSRIACVLLTFVAVLVAQAFFRANGVGDAMALLRAMVGLSGVETVFATFGTQVLSPQASMQTLGILFLLAIAWGAPNSHQILGHASPALIKGKTQASPLCWQPRLLWLAASTFGLLLCLVNLHKESRFLYFQF